MFLFLQIYTLKHNTFTTSYRTLIFTHTTIRFSKMYVHIYMDIIQNPNIYHYLQKELQCEDLGTSPLGLTKTGQCLLLMKRV